MRLNSYARLSRTDTGQHLRQQHADTRKWAHANGHIIVGEYDDDGVSGAADAEERDGLAAATAFSLPSFAPVTTQGGGEGAVDGLVVRDLDRISRDVIVQEGILRDCWRAGKRVFTVTDGEVHRDDPDNPNRKLIRVILGAVAEYDREMITKRMVAGRRHKLHRDGWGGGAVPYGWRTVNKQLVPDDREQATMLRARGIAAAWPWLSRREIGERLTVDGYHPRRGGAWKPTQIYRMLHARVTDDGHLRQRARVTAA